MWCLFTVLVGRYRWNWMEEQCGGGRCCCCDCVGNYLSFVFDWINQFEFRFESPRRRCARKCRRAPRPVHNTHRKNTHKTDLNLAGRERRTNSNIMFSVSWIKQEWILGTTCATACTAAPARGQEGQSRGPMVGLGVGAMGWPRREPLPVMVGGWREEILWFSSEKHRATCSMLFEKKNIKNFATRWKNSL